MLRGRNYVPPPRLGQLVGAYLSKQSCPGYIVAEFVTTAGEKRCIVEVGEDYPDYEGLLRVTTSSNLVLFGPQTVELQPVIFGHYNVGKQVQRKAGSYNFVGVVVCAFMSLKGKLKYVVEATGEGFKGRLHIFTPNELEEHGHAET